MESRRVRRLAAAALAIAVLTGLAQAASYQDQGPAEAGHYRNHYGRHAVPAVVSGFRQPQVPEDGEIVPDEWEPHPPLAGSVTRSGGKDYITAHHYQAGGIVDRRFAIQRK